MPSGDSEVDCERDPQRAGDGLIPLERPISFFLGSLFRIVESYPTRSLNAWRPGEGSYFNSAGRMTYGHRWGSGEGPRRD